MSRKGVTGLPQGLEANLAAALQERLSGMIGASSGFVDSLPEPVKRRVNALKNLQKKRVALEAEIQKEIQELEKKLNLQSEALFKKRAEIVNGIYEPTEEECHFSEEEDEEEEEGEEGGEAPQKKSIKGKSNTESSSDDAQTKGIPSFWLAAMQNCFEIAELVQEHDVPVLEHLTDITVDYLEGDMGYKLNFTFSENPFFTNNVLSKTYYLSVEPDPDDLVFEGPIYDHAEGTEINWKEGQDVTVKQEKKKQRKKGGSGAGKVRHVIKTVKQPSFFHFFTAPDVVGEDEEDEEKVSMMENILLEDFEIGEKFREKLIPMAVLYFTGESAMFEDDDDYDGEEEEDEDDEYGGRQGRGDDDDDDDDDDDGEGKPALPQAGEKPPECKQQ